MTTSEGLIRFVGIAAWLTLAAGIVAIVRGGLGSPLMRVQLSGDPGEIRSIIHEAADSRAMARMRRQLGADYFFLGFYWLAFVGIAIVIARRGGAEYKSAAFVAILVATLTALLDILENIRTSGILALGGPGGQIRLQPARHLRQTSLLKWAASAVTISVLSIAFLPGSSWVRVLGFVFVGVAVVGLAAVRWNGLIRVYLLLFFLLGFAIAAWFTFNPSDVVDHL